MLKKHLNYKLIAILSLLFSTLATEIAFQNPAQGYELSIYDSTPSMVWFSLIISIIGALFIIILPISMDKRISSNLWITGMFILLLNRMILLYIPYIRGYFSWRADNITHLGLLIDVLVSGFVPSKNPYPITHIFLAMVYIVTDVSRNIIVNYSTGIFSTFYVISIYLLATAILHTKKEQILAVTSVVVVFFSYNLYLMPNGWSQLYLPLFVFIFFKSLEKHNTPQYKLLLVLLLIMYPYFHPLSSLYVIFMLIIIGIVNFFIYLYLSNYKYDGEVTSQKWYSFRGQLFRDSIKSLRTRFIRASTLIRHAKYHFSFTTVLIEIAILIPWILSLQSFQLNLRMFYNSVLSGTRLEVIEGMQNTLDKINISGMDFAQLLIKSEGANFIFLGLFAVNLLILAKEKHNLQKHKNLLILSSITIFTGFIYAAYLFGIVPGLHAIAAGRIKSYITLFTPISAGFVFIYLQKKFVVKKVNLFPIICILIILAASTLSIYNLYPSPHVIYPTPSITQMDMQGGKWFISHHNKEILTVDIISPIYRFIDGAVGTNERTVIIGSIYQHKTVPDHFNYTEDTNKLGQSYLDDKYMMITMFDTIIYDTVWSMIDRFDSQDFDRLLDDTSVEKLYSNGETEIFFIHSIV